ncbi:MAG: choice-of-anchor M domain-containing protein, partial [Bifidobacteriaceae bacterium]|nr:choice-of-anchor M domain-containing protein [Bifidobacteriaceae bacterium]
MRRASLLTRHFSALPLIALLVASLVPAQAAMAAEPDSTAADASEALVVESGEVAIATRWADGEAPRLGLGGTALGDESWAAAEDVILSVPYRDSYWPGADYAEGSAGQTRWGLVSNRDTRDFRTAPPVSASRQYTENALRLSLDTSRVTAAGAWARSSFDLDAVTSPGGGDAAGGFLGYVVRASDGAPSLKAWDSENLETSAALATSSATAVGWAFTAPGVYCVALTATIGADDSSDSASAVYTVAVGVDPDTASLCAGQDPGQPGEQQPETLVVESGDVAIATQWVNGQGPVLGLGGTSFGDSGWALANDVILSLPYQDTYWPGADYPEGNAGRTRWSLISTADTRDWRTAPPATASRQYTQNGLRLTLDTTRVTAEGAWARSSFALNSVTSSDGGDASGGFLGYVIRASDGAPSLRAWDSQDLEASAAITTTSSSPLGWAFTAPGVYCVALTAVIGASDSTDTASAVYTVAVGVDPATATPCAQPETNPPGGENPGDDEQAVTFQSVGHTDLAVGDIGEEWQLTTDSKQLRDRVWVLRGAASTFTVPEPNQGNDYTFLGEPGSTYWGASAGGGTQNVTLWPGLATKWTNPAVVPASRLSWTLNGVSGPGDVWVYNEQAGSQSSPASVLYSTRWGLPASYTTFSGAHDHMYWSFTQQGVYCLNFEVSGRLANGTAKSANGQLTVAVGDVNLDQVVPCERRDTPAPLATLPVIDTPLDDAIHAVDQGQVTFLPGMADSQLQIAAGVRERSTSAARYANPEELILSSSGEFLGNGTGVGSGQPNITFDIGRLSSDITISVGDVTGPGNLTMLRASAAGGTNDTLFSFAGNSVTEGKTTFLTGHHERSVYARATTPGVYCIPLTWTTTTAGEQVSASTVLTYVLGSADPADPHYIDRGTVIPCADGGSGGEEPGDGGDDGNDPAFDVYVPNHSRTDNGQLILNAGHVDIASQIENGSLVSSIKDTTESIVPQYLRPRDVVLQLLPESRSVIPEGDDFAFLGAAGNSVWQLSETQQQGLLWPGWSTEEIPIESTQAGVLWRLDAISGPGEFSLYEFGAFGKPEVLLNTRDGITASDSFEIPKQTHAHGTWAFSAEGTYCLAFERSATLASGQKVNDEFTIAFGVGEVDVKKIDPTSCFDAPEGKPLEADTSPIPLGDLNQINTGDVQV